MADEKVSGCPGFLDRDASFGKHFVKQRVVISFDDDELCLFF